MGFVIEGRLLKYYTEEPGVTEAVVPEGVQEIGATAFFKCNDLTCVSLPDSLRKIGKWAFANCGKLESVTLSAGVSSLGEELFYGCDNLKNIFVSEENPCFASHGGILYDRARATYVCCPPGKTTVTLRRPLSVTEDAISFHRLKYLFIEDRRAGTPLHLHHVNYIPASELNAILHQNYRGIEDPMLRSPVAAYDFLNGLSPEAESIVKDNYMETLVWLIWNAYTEMIERLFAIQPPDMEYFDGLMEVAIVKERKELLLMLMDYKERHGGYDTDAFKL